MMDRHESGSSRAGRVCVEQCHLSCIDMNVQLGHMNNWAPASIETEMRSSVLMESVLIPYAVESKGLQLLMACAQGVVCN